MDPATDAKALPPRPNLEQYKKQAKDLVKAWKSGDAEALRFIKDHHPRMGRLAEAEIRDAAFTLADAQFSIAREHGFDSWPKLASHIEALTRDRSPVSTFESAVDAVVAGDLSTLDALLRAHPELTRERSTRVHRAMLLHYVSANGVENYRQKTPANAADVARRLLAAGAEPDALSDAYGGQSTTLGLLVSSVHPAKAGLHPALIDALVDGGAAIDGVDDDGAPLMTALKSHYPDAAAALVRRGARIDDVIAAASLGRADLVATFLDPDGRAAAAAARTAATDTVIGNATATSVAAHLSETPPRYVARWLRQLPAARDARLEVALAWAASLGQTQVVALLLRAGVPAGASDAAGSTALHLAAWYGHVETVQLLLDWHAPLETKNPYGGTPLDQTLWASLRPDDARTNLAHGSPAKLDYVGIAERLVDAGARDPGWLRDYLDEPLDERLAVLLRRVIAPRGD